MSPERQSFQRDDDHIATEGYKEQAKNRSYSELDPASLKQELASVQARIDDETDYSDKSFLMSKADTLKQQIAKLESK